MNFKPSDKVVCLVNFSQESALCIGCIILSGSPPTAGVVYSVREVTPLARAIDGYVGCGLMLVGIWCSINPAGVEYAWDARFFRKLEEVQAENREKQEMDQLLKEAQELINLY